MSYSVFNQSCGVLLYLQKLINDQIEIITIQMRKSKGVITFWSFLANVESSVFLKKKYIYILKWDNHLKNIMQHNRFAPLYWEVCHSACIMPSSQATEQQESLETLCLGPNIITILSLISICFNFGRNISDEPIIPWST